MESMRKCNLSKMWSSKMPEGLDVEITDHPISMKSVVNLIIAMERLKGDRAESLKSTEFSDEQLLSIMLESIVEEELMPEVESVPSTVEYSRGCERQCSVTDSEQRNLVMVPNNMELHAVMLQGGTRDSRVHLSMATYLESEPSAEARTVALGIKGTNFYLSCHKDGDQPTLHLEEVNKSSLATISSDSELVRFLFSQYDSGLSHSTFVSVRYNNWYISTAQGNNKPVELCQESASRHRTFNITAAQCESTTDCPVVNC